MTDLNTLADRIRCAECGKFLAVEQLPHARHRFEPDSHFGPEISEWTGPCCLPALRALSKQP